MLKHSFVVHSGDSMNGDVFFMEVGMTCLASAFKTKKRLSQFGDGYRETEIRTLANHHGDMQSYEQRNKNFRRRPQRGKTLSLLALVLCF